MAITLERWIIGQTHYCHEPFSKGGYFHRMDCSDSFNARTLRRRISNRLRRRIDRDIIAEQLDTMREQEQADRQESYELWLDEQENLRWMLEMDALWKKVA